MYLNRFRRWIGRGLTHTESLLVNALEAQRILAGYVRFHISDSGTRGPAIRRTLCLYMRYISEAVYPDTQCAVFARTLADAQAAGIPGAEHGSAFAPSRLRGRRFRHALILDASSCPCHTTGSVRPDSFADIFRCVMSEVDLRGSVVIVHGDAFVRGHSFFKYLFYRTVKASTSRFVAVAASPPPPLSARRLALRERLDALANARRGRRVWDWTEQEHRLFYSRYCRRDISWPQYMCQVRQMKENHDEETRQRRQALAIRRQIFRETLGWESVPKYIPTLEDLASQPPLLCMTVRPDLAVSSRRRSRPDRFRMLSSEALRRLCLGPDSQASRNVGNPPAFLSFLQVPVSISGRKARSVVPPPFRPSSARLFSLSFSQAPPAPS